MFGEGDAFWLAGGFHRHAAALAAGFAEFPCDVRPGGLREAILHSVGANATHGIRRTNADKRRAVLMLLEDEEWSGWADREIARRCAVSDTFVNRLRADLTANVCSEPPARTYQDRHGNVTQMRTGAIGKRPAEPEPAPLREDAARQAPLPEAAPAPAPPLPFIEPSAGNVVRLGDRLGIVPSPIALEIEAQAKRRLADEYDAAQERGEVSTGRDGPGAGVLAGNAKATVADLGLTRKAVHEARRLRDAEAADPGVIRHTLDARPRVEAQRDAGHFPLTAIRASRCDIAMVEAAAASFQLRELRRPVQAHSLDHRLHHDPAFALVFERGERAAVKLEPPDGRGLQSPASPPPASSPSPPSSQSTLSMASSAPGSPPARSRVGSSSSGCSART